MTSPAVDTALGPVDASSPETAIAVSGLGLRIGGVQILDGVTLSATRGELLGVIGPNGAGKTTLFNLISGTYTPTTGTVTLDGVDVTHAPIHRRARAGLGRTFQTSNLFPRLSVLENVRLAVQSRLGGSLSVLRSPRRGDDASREARRHLAEVELTPRAGVAAGDLSHGDKRKLEVAVLLAMEPSVILLDEPMAGVSVADIPGLTAVIRRLRTDLGCTVLIVEHHIDVVLGLVDRVAVMHHGRLLACDEPTAIMADPVVQQAYLGGAA